MKAHKPVLFTLICCTVFIALLALYALVLFDAMMPRGETYEDPYHHRFAGRLVSKLDDG